MLRAHSYSVFTIDVNILFFLFVNCNFPLNGTVCVLLFQAAWEEVQQCLVELAQTRSAVQQLKKQLETRRKEAEREVSGIADELHNDTIAL